MIDRRPAIIARCTGAADVVAAVNFARTSGLEVAVRSGGHSVPGYAVCDGGIVIDLSPMKGRWVDPDARTARAQTGLTWGEFDRETQMFGLATTGGRITTTGIGGQTLGSGSGWLGRRPDRTLWARGVASSFAGAVGSRPTDAPGSGGIPAPAPAAGSGFPPAIRM